MSFSAGQIAAFGIFALLVGGAVLLMMPSERKLNGRQKYRDGHTEGGGDALVSTPWLTGFFAGFGIGARGHDDASHDAASDHYGDGDAGGDVADGGGGDGGN